MNYLKNTKNNAYIMNEQHPVGTIHTIGTQNDSLLVSDQNALTTVRLLAGSKWTLTLKIGWNYSLLIRL